MAVAITRIVRDADICLECGVAAGWHEKTCLVYVLELEEYRDRLEEALYRIHNGEVGKLGYAD